MPQNDIDPVFRMAPVNAQALQQPISLSCAGGYIMVGAPTSLVAYSDPRLPMMPLLAGSATRGIGSVA